MSTHVSNESVWRGTTEDERAAARRLRLIEVALDLIGEQGAEGVTVRGVCAHAKLNPRYFYESFASVDDLLRATFDHVLEGAERAALEAIAAAPDTAEAKVRAAIGTTIRYVVEDPRMFRVVFDTGATNGVLAERRVAAISRTAGRIADQAAAFSRTRRDDTTLVSTAVMLAGATTALLVAWDDGALGLSLDETIDQATDFVLAGLVRATSAGRR